MVWDEPTKTVQLIRGYNVLKFRVGSKESNFYQTYWRYHPNDDPWYLTYEAEFGDPKMYIKKCYKMMDVAPIIRGDRTYLPARYVAEGFGANVAWDDATKTVSLWQPPRKSSPFPRPAGLNTLGFKVGDKNAYVNCTVREEQKVVKDAWEETFDENDPPMIGARGGGDIGWTGYCDLAPQITVQGKTLEEAMKNVKKQFKMHLKNTEEKRYLKSIRE